MLFNRNDLGYTVVSEIIVNGEEVLLIGETVESVQCTIYQVVFNGGVILNTLEVIEAKNKFDEIVKDVIKRLTNLKIS